MRTQAGLMVAVLIAALGLQTESSAQGMFGPRELGKPLKPRASRFGSGLGRGPSGNFLGRSTADRGTTFQARQRPEPTSPWLVPPDAYNLEPEMVPGYLEEQARRMAAAYQQQQQQLQQLHARQAPQQQAQPSFPPVMPPRPDRYLPPPMPTQPGFPQPQPRVPGPAQQPPLQNSPDRWFRGAPAPTQSDQMAPATSSQRNVQTPGLGPVGTLGPSGVRGQAGLNRSNPATLGPRINQTLGARARGPISATIQGDTAVLQGTVATAADRQLAERMAAMEPGVRRIDNRITVVVAPPGP